MKKELYEIAKAARNNAYAPYSKFPVGCCIKTTNGKIFCGSNIENSSRPASVCAEVAAVAHMIQGGEREIAEVVIVGDKRHLCVPCGNCRQILMEFSNPDTKIHVCHLDGHVKTFKITDLLATAYGREDVSYC